MDWNAVKANGISFTYIKATEGTGLINPNFAQQYIGSYNVGPGNVQADYFVTHGGGWSLDVILATVTARHRWWNGFRVSAINTTREPIAIQSFTPLRIGGSHAPAIHLYLQITVLSGSHGKTDFVHFYHTRNTYTTRNEARTL